MRLFLFLIILLTHFSCTPTEDLSFLESPKMDFMEALNAADSIDDFYWRQGALFWNDRIYKHRDSISKHLNQLGEMERFESLKTIQHDSLGYFELGYYYTKDSLLQEQKTAYLIAWKNEAGQWLKELEILYPKEIQAPTPKTEIDEARQLWEQLSNAQAHEILVDSVYSPTAFYFNDGYIYKGQAAIRDKYQYMSQEKWHIKLATIQTIQVNDSLFYDVGQYKSSGHGHYCILWELQEEGDWRVLLDFNF